MKVWISSYALSSGIKESEAELCHTPGMIKEVGVSFGLYHHGEGKEWHRTKQGACLRAEEMRTAKLASLRKQITKLERLSFYPPSNKEGVSE